VLVQHGLDPVRMGGLLHWAFLFPFLDHVMK
jgi:hypothetical protein